MNIRRPVSEKSSQQSCRMVGVFGTSSSSAVKQSNLLPPYQAAGKKNEKEKKKKNWGGSGCGGLSVLEESHVVSESGQLLLVWNQ